MLYNYDFDVAAFWINTLLLVIILTRKNFKNINNYILKGIIAVNEIAIVFDLWSIFTISFPEKYSMALNYFVSIVYYMAHNMSAILFAMYGLHTTRMEAEKRKRAKGVIIGVAIFEFILIATTSLTKFAFYYDSDMVYKHGSLIWMLYVLAILIVVYVLYLKIKNIENQSSFQFVSIAFYIGIIVFSYLFNMVFPEVLVELCGASIGLVFVYIAQDGPEAYSYKKLHIFNRYAFEERTKTLFDRNKRFKVLVFMPKDAKIFKENYGHNQIFTIEKCIMTKCVNIKRMSNKLFAMSEMCMALIIRDEESEEKYIDEINSKFNNTIKVDGRNYNFEMTYGLIKCPEVIKSYSELIDVVTPLIYRISTNAGDDIIEVDDSWVRKETEKEIVKTLKNSIKNKEIYMEYLPIFDCDTLYSYIAEANIKFKKRDNEYIYLSDVAHIAEKHGLMPKIDELSLVKISEFVQSKNILELGTKCIVVNLSATRLYDRNFSNLIISLMEKYNIPKEKICFEIKELKSREAQPIVRENIKKIAEKGFTFMLGNFGENRLDLDFILSIPVSTVMISKKIVENITVDDRKKSALKDMIKLFKNVGIDSGCEGVSLREEEKEIKKSTCKYVSGPRYSNLLTEDQYIGFLKSQFKTIMEDISERG